MLYFASDLHYGMCRVGDRATRALAEHLRGATRQDVLVLVGDLAKDEDALRECLEFFRGFPGHAFAVPGNHDVWMHSAEEADSDERRRRFNETVRAFGIHPLEDEPVVVNGVGLAGTMGWYDYSFRDDELGIPLDVYRCKSYGEWAWSDAQFVRWPRTDEEETTLDADRLDSHLRTLAGAREIVVVTHHVPTKQLLFYPRSLVPQRWRFLNAFLGSERFREVIERHPAVRLAVCGHIHTAKELRLNRRAFVSIGGSYHAKQLVAWDGARISRTTFR